MLSSILKVIGVQKGEEKPVLLLLSKGFFVGIFIATYQVVAQTLFLDTFVDDGSGNNRYLEIAFFASGGLGVISALLFSFLQNRMRFSRLAVLNLLLIFLFVVGIIVSFQISVNKWIVFSLFVMIGPTTALIILGFWGVFGRLFNLRQSKRIVGGIDSGQILAIILAFYAVPFLTNVITDLKHFLVFAALGMLGAICMLLLIIKNYDIDQVQRRSREEMRKTDFSQILKDKYIILLSLFLMCSMVAFKFVDFSFLTVTAIQFPIQKDLASFIGFVNGSIYVISFLIQTFVNERLINSYGLKIALLVLPVVLLVLTVAAVFLATFFGYTIESEYFLWFFLAVTLSKLFTTSLKDALENPVFKLFFLPLDIKVRFDIQAKIEGVINQFSGLIAGIFITLLGALSFFKLIHYSYFLLVVVIAMIYVTGRLYEEYRNTLKDKLGRDKKQQTNFTQIEDMGSILKKNAQNSDDQVLIKNLEILSEVEPLQSEELMLGLLPFKSVRVKKYILNQLEDRKDQRLLPGVKKYRDIETDTELQSSSSRVYEHLSDDKRMKLSNFQFFVLVRSKTPLDRIYAARVVANMEDDSYDTFLIDLLQDLDTDVRIAAIVSAAKLKKKKFWPLLVENLSSPVYGHAAMVGLSNLGEQVLQVLESAFYKSGQSTETLIRIITIYGRIGGAKAIELLWNKIDYPESKVIVQIFKSLHECGFRATDYRAVRIKNTLTTLASDIAWNLAISQEIPIGDDNSDLVKAVNDETGLKYQDLFRLLSLLHEPHSVQLVKENVESGDSEDINFAIELLDVFLEEDLKPILFPLLDDLSVSERLRRLQIYFPKEKYAYGKLLKQLVNRDFDKTNRWTRACALNKMTNFETDYVSPELKSNLFNPDPILSEQSALAIYNTDPDEYAELSDRISIHNRQQLNRIMGNAGNQHQIISRFDLVRTLSQVEVFASCEEIFLVELSDHIEQIFVRKGQNYNINTSTGAGHPFVFVYNGLLRQQINGTEKRYFINFQLLEKTPGDDDIKNYSYLAEEDTMLLKIERYRLMSVLVRNTIFAKKVIPALTNGSFDNLEVNESVLEQVIT